MLKAKYKNLLLGGLVALVLVMGIAFSVFQTNLNIEGTSNISNTWDIRITKIEAKNDKIVGHAKDDEENPASFDDLTANFNALLYYEGDSITYDITVRNSGTLDATLTNIEKNINTNSDKIDIEYSGFTKGQVLYKNTEEVVTIKITYKSETALADTNNNIKQLNTNNKITPTLLDNEIVQEEASISIKFLFNQEGQSGETPTTKYLVTYDCDTNGGEECSDYEEYQKGNADLTKTATKENYDFVGWNTNKDATEGLQSLTVNQDTTLYAIYKKIFTVTYTKGDNIASASKETDSCNIYNNNQEECTVTLPTITPISDVYEVLGWYKDDTKVGDPNDTYTLTSNDTLTSKVKQNKFTLTYNYNGATGGNTSVSKQVTYNGTYGDLPEPTKTGYTFKGWYKESSFTNLVESTDTYNIEDDSEIYAKWEDETKPVCTYTTIPSSIAYNATATFVLQCTDEGSGISSQTLSTDNFSTSNLEITNIENPATVTNGYSWNITAKATTGTGSASLAFKNNVISDTEGNYNDAISANSTTLSKIAGGINVTEANATYDGNAHPATFTSTSGEAVTPTYYSDSSCSTKTTTSNAASAGGAPKNAGTYYATATTSGNNNYNSESLSCTKAVTITKQSVNAPTNVAVSTAGIVTWTNSSNATGYEISIDNSNFASATSGVNYLSTIIGSAGNRTVYVRAINSDTTNYSNSTNATQTVTVSTITFSATNGTVSDSSYKVINGITYEASSNQILIKSGNTTLKTVTATNNTGYTFSSWNSTSGTINGDTTLTSTFTDVTRPTVTLSPSSQSSYVSGGKAVTVTLADTGSGLSASQNVYYAWSTSSTTAPTYTSYVTSTNTAGAKSATITVPASASSSLTGTYYLWIKVGTVADVSGNTSLVKTSSAFKFDNSAPSLSVATTKTTSTIGVTATASALSEITKYEFSKDGGSTYVDNGTTNTYTFSNLTHNTSYNIVVRVTSGVSKTKTASPTTNPVTTTQINTPTFTDTTITNGKKVTITYPDGCTNYTCEYSTNSGSSWTTVTTTTKELYYTTVGTYNIIAKVTDPTYSSNVVTTITHNVTIIEPSAENTIQKLGATVVTSGNGLYQDSTETDRYIYKGSNPSNYIEFNGETWRIYSIESDGGVKIIRNDLLSDTKQFDSSGSSGRRTSGYCSDWAPISGCNAWAKTDNFINASKSGAVSEDSDLNTYLNGTTSDSYYYSLIPTAKSQIQEHSWNIGPSGNRDSGWNSSILVPEERTDTWVGNIALLTNSEYIRANSNTSTYCDTAVSLLNNGRGLCKSTNYLSNSSNNWWLISPASGSDSGIFIAYTDGVDTTAPSSTLGVRPALYLKNTLNFTGSGTNDSNIYKIS